MSYLGMKRVSDKRAQELKDSRSVKQAVLERDGGCVVLELVPSVRCWGRVDPHHILRRGQGGKDTLANMVAVCRGHHSWLHDHVAEAKALGLLR